MPALEYARVADLYDAYCAFTGDLEFFRSQAAAARGRILELMAGTGRVSLPLAATAAELVCVDIVPAMLAVLARKLNEARRHAGLVCADVCRLPFAPSFSLAVLPFQGLTELLSEHDRRLLFESVHRALRAGGRFICTSHNPPVRARTIDGAWHEAGVSVTADGGSLRLSLHTEPVHGGRGARGQQRLERLAADGSPVEVRVVDLEFSLPPVAEIVSLAEQAGFRCVSLLGDYAGAPFEEPSSAVIIAILEKDRGTRLP